MHLLHRPTASAYRHVVMPSRGVQRDAADLDTLSVLNAEQPHLTVCQQQAYAVVAGGHCGHHVNASTRPAMQCYT